jgi:colanic acid/amylovoran biosynthesis glycosyltransferase
VAAEQVQASGTACRCLNMSYALSDGLSAVGSTGRPAFSVAHSFPVWLPLTQVWMHHQVAALPDDVSAHVICERTENLEHFAVERLHCFADEPAWTRFADRALRRIGLRRHLGFYTRTVGALGARVLHSHFGPTGWNDLAVARAAGVRHVVTFYGQDVNRLPTADWRWRWRYLQLFRHADRVLCEGPHLRERLVELGCASEKAVVHHLGVWSDRIAFRPRSWRQGKRLRVLIAAAFREKKGIPDALDALGRIASEVELEVTVIGDAGQDAAEQAEKRRIFAAAAAAPIAGRVRFLGFQPYEVLIDESYRHHVFMAASRTARDGDTEGGAPVVLADMAATGIVLVSTSHCDIPELVEHGVTGLLAPEGDVGGIAGCLRWLVSHPEAWQKLSRAARDRVEAEFDARRQGERLARIYREVAGVADKGTVCLCDGSSREESVPLVCAAAAEK